MKRAKRRVLTAAPRSALFFIIPCLQKAVSCRLSAVYIIFNDFRFCAYTDRSQSVKL